MFIEPRVGNRREAPRRGWIEVVCGSMFSGKTEELIRRLNRARIARQRVEIFKPALDTRYHADDVVIAQCHQHPLHAGALWPRKSCCWPAAPT